MPRFPERQEINSLFILLDVALKGVTLDREEGLYRSEDFDPAVPKASEFMLMQIGDGGEAQFKHRDTRNYVLLYPGGRLAIPKTENPFHRGQF